MARYDARSSVLIFKALVCDAAAVSGTSVVCAVTAASELCRTVWNALVIECNAVCKFIVIICFYPVNFIP